MEPRCGEEEMAQPIAVILHFHTVIRQELDWIHKSILSVEHDDEQAIVEIVDRYNFLKNVYEHHCRAEDGVILPALDSRVKNVAPSYVIEHFVENKLFDQMAQLLKAEWRKQQNDAADFWEELRSCAEAIQTTICQHLAKEESQVLPLLMRHFIFEEQAKLVWQFVCHFPVYLIQRLLVWLASALSGNESKHLTATMKAILPREDLVHEVFFGWLNPVPVEAPVVEAAVPTVKPGSSPLSGLVHWHKAILEELHQVGEDFKQICALGTASASILESLAERIEFLAAIWDFHNAAEDQIVLHKELKHQHFEKPFSPLRIAVKEATETVVPWTILSQLEVVLTTIENHFLSEETELIPLACQLYTVEEQLGLLHEGLRMMPLSLLERALPWVAAAISQEEAELMLVNMRLAAPETDRSFVELLLAWACRGSLDNKVEEGFDVRPAKAQVSPLSTGSLVGFGRLNRGTAGTFKPIDQIFQFHKAIRKDLEYLDMESLRLENCNDDFLERFSSRFHFLWGLYRAHSSAEENIVFPALEAKQGLSNVSRSYTMDHEQDEDFFKQIARVLSEFSDSRGNSGLGSKLRRMCKSIRISLDQHVSKEEMILWPLFERHFTVEELTKLMERIIGATGAEIIRAMLPWVREALTQEEQESMMQTWQVATRNTMFQKWLGSWWEDAPFHSAKTEHVPSASATACMSNADMELLRDDDFKPGWPEIFKLNQEELGKAVRRVYGDASIDPRRKDYLVQNLMTSRWMAAQQKMHNPRPHNVSERLPSFNNKEEKIFGCKHYKRNCKLKAYCCGALFTCRLCHDEACDHSMDRYQTEEMMCMKCLEVQPIGPSCSTESCIGYSMGLYYCPICKFFDNDGRSIYHCPFCNICRVGAGLGEEFFHCMVCNGCMSKSLMGKHICEEKAIETKCPICCDPIFSSVLDVRALPCGHFMHIPCYAAYTSSNYTCPICCKTIGDMSVYFGMLDGLLAAEQLPDEYKGRRQAIYCNDCSLKAEAAFHWLYHKCSRCGSYNTKTI